jgi:hypothetical protein
VLLLTLIFLLHGVPYLGIKILNSLVFIKHGYDIPIAGGG